MPTTAQRLGPVDVAGGLWGADLLAALADDRTQLPADTVNPTSYQLPARAATEQAARAAWTVLTAAWEEFSEHHTARIERDGTEAYGDDTFTLQRWTSHLLTQLGYQLHDTPTGGLRVDDEHTDDADRDRYSITHLHHDQVPVHLLAAGVPLDTRTRGVIGAHRQSPHSLVQDYLNRTSTHLWAVVTNGLTLRILRDNAALSRQAYIEFDLAAIFDNGAYADFALLWHAAHATRFTHDPDHTPADCIAETWQEHATATGVAALEDLRVGVEAAIAEIGQGLLEHRDNAALRDALDDPEDPFDAAALYRELLYIAYRHVFWFTLDDRNLLHPPGAERQLVALYRDHYASTVLRSRARAHLGGHHPDAWQHLHTISTWFADPDGQPALALPGLLGRLWEPETTAHLNHTTLTNRRYYEAVRRLGYVTRDDTLQRINYDALGSEELGAVYEALLEIRPIADTTRRTFTLGRTSGSDRKKTGSYYTPTSLIKILLDEALDPVLDQRTKQALHDLPADATPDQRRHAQEEAVLTTTVCDPAMGSAHFLVGAGMRMAKRLAQIRTDEIEPSPDAIQHAFRDIASRCLFGVDINPMAVELAKVAIWLECHVPGQPLTFLDHHLKTGNALVGVGFDPELITWHRAAKRAADQKGVPDAAFKPLAGDDKAHARLLRDRNKQRRGSAAENVRFHGSGTHHDRLNQLADRARQLDELADDSPSALAAKQQAFADVQQDAELQRQGLRADAWMASWTFPKTKEASESLTSDDPLADDELPWDVYYDTFLDNGLQLDRPGVHAVRDEAARLAFFHWHLEFPDIAAEGGFGLMLGNPPWERIKLQEKEWFAAAGHDEVVAAGNAAARKRAIAALAESTDEVERATAQRWQRDSRDSQATSEFVRTGGRFPLGGTGDVNTYALFSDHFFSSVHHSGRVGIITPTGLLTDYSFREFASALLPGGHVVVALGMSNAGGFFPGVSAIPFMLLVLAKTPPPEREVWVSTGLTSAAEWQERAFQCSAADLVACNPNTKTLMPVTSGRALGLLLELYRRLPPLEVVGQGASNPWDATFPQPFHMTNDSGEFRTEPQPRDLPLLEGKMVTGYNYRTARMLSKTKTEPVAEVDDPNHPPEPHYWVSPQAVDRRTPDGEFLMVVRLISSRSTAHTLMSALVPRVGIGNSMAVVDVEPDRALILVAMFNSFILDFVLRNKIEDANVNIFVLRQLPMPPPDRFLEPAPWGGGTLGDWLARRAAGLSGCTRPVSDALGLSTPAIWDAALRRQWRSEIDAAAFHLFGLSRSDTEFVLDTFFVIAARDRQHEGLADDDTNWRTKRLILAKYDELAEHARAGTTYVSPEPPPPLPEKLRLLAETVAADA